MAADLEPPKGGNQSPICSSTTTTTTTTRSRNSPYLPTPIEVALLLSYPFLLIFGMLFSVLSPTVRNAPYDTTIQAHVQEPSLSPSYFARKSNLFNVLFVKRGWAWITFAFFLFLFTHPGLATTRRRAGAAIRWVLVTTWWVLVTQWCFGPALIDRGFRVTGGKCERVLVDDYDDDDEYRKIFDNGITSLKNIVTGVACKAAGGAWRGGHDISGHVFLLVLGSYFLLQEVGWVYMRHGTRGSASGTGPDSSFRDERNVVMQDGAVKSAAVEAELQSESLVDAGPQPVVSAPDAWDALGLGGKIASGVVALSWWMILMTAIYFHTWFEKCTGLLMALTGLYTVYFLPRFVPAVRGFVGLPGL